MEETKRLKLSECKKVIEEDDIPGTFTSVRGAYYIPQIDKIGYYKQNECIIDSFWDADLRELLASRVLEAMGVPHADVVLAYDDENDEHGCFSINILGEDERFVDLIAKDIYGQYHNATTIQELMKTDLEMNSKLPGITPEFIEQRRKFVAQYLFVSAIISNTDVGITNMQVIYNEKTGEYRNPEYYDAGVSFVSNSLRRFFLDKSAEKILSELYRNYPKEIEEIAHQTEQTLTKDKIKEILSDPVFDEFKGNIKNNIMRELIIRANLISRYNANIDKYGTAEPEGISMDDIYEDIKDTDISLKDKVLSFINKLKDKIIGKDIGIDGDSK